MAPARYRLIAFCAIFLGECLLPAPFAESEDLHKSESDRDRQLSRDYTQAAHKYESGNFPDAAALLEKIIGRDPNSFEAQELLGLVYAAQSQNEKASRPLKNAVSLRLDSSSARTNLANNLLRLGKIDQAEQQFKKAAALAPDDYDANHNLGEFYAGLNRVGDSIPFLERAQQIAPSYNTGYDLSLDYLLIGRATDARKLIQTLIASKDTAELHNLLGQVEEKDGNFVAAASEFQAAAHIEPSESNIFDWGGELLVHRTLEPAVAVYRQGTERFPKSSRMAIGLGMAYYSLGRYDDAVQSLLRAVDLDPQDGRGYVFLSKAFDSSPTQADAVIERLRRYTELEPNSGLATYYYALSLWKGRRSQSSNLDLGQIERLMKKAIALQPDISEAHLQLGNLYSDQHKYAESIPEYLRVRELDPNLADAHYRLAQAYVHTNQSDLAEREFKIYQELDVQHLADSERQRAEIRQFVYSTEQGKAATP